MLMDYETRIVWDLGTPVINDMPQFYTNSYSFSSNSLVTPAGKKVAQLERVVL